MAVTSPSVSKKAGWLGGCVVAILLIIGVFLPQTVYRFYLYHADLAIQKGELDSGKSLLEQADGFESFLSYSRDKAFSNRVRGDYHFALGEGAKSLNFLTAELEQAAAAYRASLHLNPLYLDAFTGLARTVDSLARIYPFLYKKEYPDDPLEIYQQLMALMPVNMYSHALLTRFYEGRKLKGELAEQVARSVAIYPPLYFQLKQQPFYTKSMNASLKDSLQQAIGENIFVEQSFAALSDIAEQEGDYKRAVTWYLQAQPEESYKDHSSYYLRLGRYQMLAGMQQEAAGSFTLALEEQQGDKTLEGIFNLYRRENLCKDFLLFAKQSEERFDHTQYIDILKARCFIEIDQLTLATSSLITVDSSKYLAEATALLAEIAEKDKDWDLMEVKSQRATVLEPENYRYHLLFSKALQHQKKYLQAEVTATNAIQVVQDENPRLYNHRAWLRWQLQNYDGAAADWERAVKIAPNRSDFYYNLALVYEKGGNIRAAKRALQKALALAPATKKYRKKLETLSNL